MASTNCNLFSSFESSFRELMASDVNLDLLTPEAIGSFEDPTTANVSSKPPQLGLAGVQWPTSGAEANAPDANLRLEHLRAKNRRAQARFRERTRQQLTDLEDRRAHLLALIADRRSTWNELVRTKHQLSERFATAAAELLHTSQALSDARHAAQHAAQHATKSKPSHDRNQLAATCPAVDGSPHSLVLHGGPPSSSGLHAAISMGKLGSYSLQACDGADTFCARLKQYVTDTESKHQRSRDRITLYWQFSALEALPGKPLSFSHSLGSDECKRSMYLAFAAMMLEGSMAFAHIQALKNSVPGQCTTSLAEVATPSSQPTAAPLPDAASGVGLRAATGAGPQMLLRCGTSETCLTLTAMNNIFRNILCHARCRVPTQDFHFVLRQWQAFFSSYLVSKDAPEAQWAGKNVGGLERITPVLRECLCVVARLAREVMDNPFLTAPDYSSWSADELRSALDKAYVRTEAAVHEWNTALHFSFLVNPVLFRRLFLDVCAPEQAPYQSVEQNLLTVYRALRLTAPQQLELERVWHVWQSRVRVLEGERRNVASALDALPAQQEIPWQLVHIAEGLSSNSAGRGRSAIVPSACNGLRAFRALGTSTRDLAETHKLLQKLRTNQVAMSEAFVGFQRNMKMQSRTWTMDQALIVMVGQVMRGDFRTDTFRLAQMGAEESRRGRLYKPEPS